MKVLREDGNPKSAAMAKLEKFLRDNDMSIYQGYQGLQVQIGKWMFEVKDIESGEYSSQLPRMFSSERLVFDE